jgi:effector-associated domain 2 (EAD2)-containing protein/TIR domain-containing protein
MTEDKAGQAAAEALPPRVFISYAHSGTAHQKNVRELWVLLRLNGIDARMDLDVADNPQDWALWTHGEIVSADFVLVVASPEYRRRASGEAGAGEGAGVQWESRTIRELVYRDPEASRRRILPVVLPDASIEDIPLWLGPRTHSRFCLSAFTRPGAEALLRHLTNQPQQAALPIGQIPVMPPLDLPGDLPLSAPAPGGGPPGSGTHRRLNIHDLGKAVAAMFEVDELLDPLARARVVALLPRDIRATVPYADQPRPHLIQMITTCERFADGPAALLQALDVTVPAGADLERVKQVLTHAWWG